MNKIPEITTKIANDTLQPYFDNLYRDLNSLSAGARAMQLHMYKTYIEAEAQKTKSVGVRMQLRINLRSLLEKLGETEKQLEVNVRPTMANAKKPRFGDEAYTEFYDESGLELSL